MTYILVAWLALDIGVVLGLWLASWLQRVNEECP